MPAKIRYSLCIKGDLMAALDAINEHSYELVTAVHKNGETVAIVEGALASDLNVWYNEAIMYDPPYPKGTLLYYSPIHRKAGED